MGRAGAALWLWSAAWEGARSSKGDEEPKEDAPTSPRDSGYDVDEIPAADGWRCAKYCGTEGTGCRSFGGWCPVKSANGKRGIRWHDMCAARATHPTPETHTLVLRRH
jgi:hypothetical protein